MSHGNGSKSDGDEGCISPEQPVPPELVARYSTNRDPDLERDVSGYVEGQARGEKVKHAEKIKTEHVMGDEYEIWDVTTDKNRWWVITNLMNLYPQDHFQSLDYTLSLHIGLMMRLRSRSGGADNSDPEPFDEVFRRQEQAKDRHDQAIEAEDYQAVGMLLRECLISLIAALRRRVEINPKIERPQEANFIGWAEALLDKLCGGRSNKQLRQYLKSTAKDTWQLVNWLTHDRNASQSASSISLHACDTIVGHFIQLLVRDETDNTEQCPHCSSRHVRSHFDISIEPNGAYYATCGVCKWSSHPEAGGAEVDNEVDT